MHPDAFVIPGGLQIKSYGFCLAVGFVTGTYLTWRRAKRAGAAPSVVLNVAILAAVFGVGGARLFFVIHYWHRFADQANLIRAIFDFRSGGMEFLGGFLAATTAIMIYLLYPRRLSGTANKTRSLPVRLYVDILTPGLIWGLAITRIGCFLNGCCFGGVCMKSESLEAAVPWAMRFPYGSPPYKRQWEHGLLNAPEELVVTVNDHRQLIPRSVLAVLEPEYRPDGRMKTESRITGEGGSSVSEVSTGATTSQGVGPFNEGRYPTYLAEKLRLASRIDPSQRMSIGELKAAAQKCVSLPIHPTQLYAAINAFLLYGLISSQFQFRKRHGLVFVTMLLLYPISRFLLEAIRSDNPRDMIGLTASQFVSVSMFVCGLVFLILLYKHFPAQEAYAHPIDSGGRKFGKQSAGSRRSGDAANAKPRAQKGRPSATKRRGRRRRSKS